MALIQMMSSLSEKWLFCETGYPFEKDEEHARDMMDMD